MSHAACQDVLLRLFDQPAAGDCPRNSCVVSSVAGPLHADGPQTLACVGGMRLSSWTLQARASHLTVPNGQHSNKAVHHAFQAANELT